MRWPDGTIAFAFESFKEFDDPGPGRHAAWLMVSRDGGESFSRPLLVAQHPQHARSTIGTSGSAPARTTASSSAMFWTHDLARKRDLNVHLRRGTITADTISVDPIRSDDDPRADRGAVPVGRRAAAGLRGRSWPAVDDDAVVLARWRRYVAGGGSTGRLYPRRAGRALAGPRERRLSAVLGGHGQVEFRASGHAAAGRRPPAAGLVRRHAGLHEPALGPRGHRSRERA